ncbi:MAG: NADH dehydrogenase [Sulfurovum sp. PC08-66]|nr:MAG: NADH dehydrogenase [Sulfurovum sp. PC08-66]KIM12606.1 MAG: NADH dehydrogenase [Sulfuricurvum sp. PC08-66]
MSDTKTVQIPLGSQHIALLEPVAFTFQTQNERIIAVDADVGFVHRGVERACASTFTFDQVATVVARVCGLCAITHSTSYVLAVEELLGVSMTPRIAYLRMLMVELDRIHSHMLCLAHTAENAGFEALFMQIMHEREIVMRLQESITGNRVQFDYVTIGGVNRDIDAMVAAHVDSELSRLREKIEHLYGLFDTNITLSRRYQGIGVLSLEDAMKLNALGPIARASGLAIDVRSQTSTFPYHEVGYAIQTHTAGDIDARNRVRLAEIFNSIEMSQNIVRNIPEGEIIQKVRGKPNGQAIVRIEAPRGEIFYLVRGSGNKILDRVRIKTPTFSTIPAMIRTFEGSMYADAPAILASFDPCMSCTAK